MSDLDVLCKLLPKYTITYIEKKFYKIDAGFDVMFIRTSASERVSVAKEIHDNYDYMLQFLALNDFILQSDTKYPYYVHKFLHIRVRINIQTIYINDLPFHLVDEFYQIIRKRLDLDSLNKQVIGIDYIEDV
jgi:hypothetical protein